jgi:hypothetical protein
MAVDDDLLITTSDSARMFAIWREHPLQIVGPWQVMRYASSQTFEYGSAITAYNLLLTSCALLHREYLILYSSDMLVNARAFVDERMNGEDLLMNFVVAASSHLPPVACSSAIEVPLHPHNPCPVSKR